MLGRERAIVVSGAQGMDEASLAGENTFVLLDQGDIIPFKLRAEDVGLTAQPLSAIRGGSPAENAEIMRELLNRKAKCVFRYSCFKCRHWLLRIRTSGHDERRNRHGKRQHFIWSCL